MVGGREKLAAIEPFGDGGWWLVVSGWWLVVSGCWVVVCGWWFVVAGWWLVVVGGWWYVAKPAIPTELPDERGGQNQGVHAPRG